MKYEAFVRAWQGAKSASDAGKATGMHPMQASRLAWRLRKRGIPLKRFVNNQERIDADALSRIAAECAPKTEAA